MQLRLVLLLILKCFDIDQTETMQSTAVPIVKLRT